MNYYDYQAQIATGDWIETQGNSGIGKKIMHFTGYDVNHSALVIKLSEYEGDTPRRWVIEALGHGLELNLLSDLIKDNNFGYWYRLKPEYEHLRRNIGIKMINEYSARRGEKKDYDLWDMVKNAWRKVRLDPSAWYCTEWCQWTYGPEGRVGILTEDQCKIAMVPGEIESFQKHVPKIKLTINQGGSK